MVPEWALGESRASFDSRTRLEICEKNDLENAVVE
jgi:hypothetical protein